MSTNGPEFFQTVMGHKFYEGDVPRIARALEEIAAALYVKAEPPPVDPNDPGFDMSTPITAVVQDVLTQFAGVCLDNPGERQRVGDALVKAILDAEPRSFSGTGTP